MSGLDEVLAKERFPVKIGGKEYKARKLEASDLGEFRAWVKEERLKLLLRAAEASGMSQDVLMKAIDNIINTQAELITGADGEVEINDPLLAEMKTEAGMQYLIWLSLRKDLPKLTLEEVAIDLDELKAVADIIGLVVGGKIEEEGEAKGPPFVKKEKESEGGSTSP